MDVYYYSYNNDIGEFVLLSILEGDKVLIYSLSNKTFPRFKIILGSVFEICKKVDKTISISIEELSDKFLAYKIVLKRNNRSLDIGQQKLLKVCENYLKVKFLGIEK